MWIYMLWPNLVAISRWEVVENLSGLPHKGHYNIG